MGFTESLTIVFIVLKLIGKIHWNWFLVLLPEIIGLVFYVIIGIITVQTSTPRSRRSKKHE